MFNITNAAARANTGVADRPNLVGKRLDMSLFKDVPLQGSARLQLRMEI